MKRSLFLLLCFIGFSLSAQVQTPDGETFRTVWSAGLLGSQVDGDTYAGYNHPGYFVGLGVNRKISRKFELEFALTFLQKGARKNYATDSASLANPNNQFYLLRLNYLEVPFLVRFHLYKKFKGEVGAAFAYLFKYDNMEQSQNGYYNDHAIKDFDYSAFVGGGYQLNEKVLINLRYEYSVVPFRQYYQSSNGIYHGQFPYSLFNRGLYNNVLILSINYKLPPVAASPTNGQ